MLPEPTRADLHSTADTYLIGAYDEIRVDVFGVDRLSNQNIQVDASGRISFPLAGTIEAAGQSPAELAALLEARLKAAYVRDPRVTVNLTKIVSQLVTVEGEVKEPGIYPILGKMTLLKAVASAKGTTEFSKLEDVVIFRTVNGKSYAALYNLRAIRSGAYADPLIFSGDIVMVGESRGRRLFKDFLQVLPLLSTPLIVALQN
ncbi:polysaccharide biosynthesis/export family protein [Sphingomonas sp. BK235]|uniref:polysaccharide biosynthesis/export family protein n=1 Tax=Sphingomonas sp. BK235 TaxID=2512131 RepID=UPI0010471FBE|nr:polysaccharide biosynthesis/export family protein [Sphingomonas sp. BK235]TCP29367.1 polysaccharide export outer membrane protein [Sphingomonas sp. BK235]